VPVIRKALVELDGAPFRLYAKLRDSWKLEDSYRNPGAIQYFGPFADVVNATLQIEHPCKTKPKQLPSTDDKDAESSKQRRSSL